MGSSTEHPVPAAHLAISKQRGEARVSYGDNYKCFKADFAPTCKSVSIPAVLGMLHIVVDRARQAKREGKKYGGSFMIFE
ncbi:MAG: hypothetical protein EZS28_043159 [Streblomastix strix]|uniref:Uncharacterized protein n=1 Tax=Streblomastix strix TaxID=222440 RepID=A0A5J4TV81_9EUKA|nr:MAG: hypothetical protein EZS28_043159 [Streblomastix strix]